MTEIEYRTATVQDEKALAALWWELQAAHRTYEPVWYADRGEETCTASWRERFRCLLEDENALIVVASCRGTAVGMIVAELVDRPPVFTMGRMLKIDTTVVHREFRRSGVFRGMLALLTERARAAGVQVMRLNVHHRNTEARRAYERSGFEPEAIGMIRWIDTD